MIWEFFTVEDQVDEVAKCKTCLKGIRTTPLHKQAQEKVQREEQSRKEEGARFRTISKAKETNCHESDDHWRKFRPKKYWDINNHRSAAIHQKIMNAIAIDNQPFSIELLAHIQPKYMLPSRRYFLDVMLLNANKEVKPFSWLNLTKFTPHTFRLRLTSGPAGILSNRLSH